MIKDKNNQLHIEKINFRKSYIDNLKKFLEKGILDVYQLKTIKTMPTSIVFIVYLTNIFLETRNSFKILKFLSVDKIFTFLLSANFITILSTVPSPIEAKNSAFYISVSE